MIKKKKYGNCYYCGIISIGFVEYIIIVINVGAIPSTT